MAEYRLIDALPQSLPGNIEFHYGHKCEVRQDGIWVELDEVTAENFVVAKRIVGPVIKDSKISTKQEKVVEDVIQESEEIVEKPKRGPKAKEQ